MDEGGEQVVVDVGPHRLQGIEELISKRDIRDLVEYLAGLTE